MLAGCSADDVEFNGKIFDAVGLNQKTEKGEPKLAERAPLVIPPDLQRVPEPGVSPESAAAASTLAAVDDPDARAKQNHAELSRQQAEYCKVHYEQAKARGDDNADLAAGPLGPCKGSFLSALKGWTKGDDDDDQDQDAR